VNDTFAAVLLFVMFFNISGFLGQNAGNSAFCFSRGMVFRWSAVVSASVACNFLVKGEISRFPYVSRKRRDA
jgi:hypothetical protein